jgi:hypothetical protein
MDEKERIILGQVIKRPELFSLIKNSKGLFKNEKSRRVFNALESLISKDSSHIDEFLLAEASGLKAEEIINFSEGVHRIPEENFAEHLRRLEQRNFAEEFFQESEKQKKIFLKGIDPDFNPVLQIAEKIKQSSIDIEKKGPRAETLQEFLAHDLPKRQPLINPLFGLQEMTMLHGRPKIGKSLLTLQIARSVITGEAFLGFEVYKQERPILIIQVEIAQGLMQERARKIFKDIAGSEKIIIPFQNRNIFIDQKSGRKHISHLIEDYKPALVILDPYLKFFTDEETAFIMMRNFKKEKSAARKHSGQLRSMLRLIAIGTSRESLILALILSNSFGLPVFPLKAGIGKT